MRALLYHTHHNRYSEDLSFWLSLAQAQGSPVLELGCGSGRVLAALAQAGLQVYGLDHDREMLAFLCEQLPASADVQARVFQSDMAAFHLAALFPLVVLACNTLSTLPAEARRKTLTCVRQHLAPGGVFAASVPNPQVLADLPVRGESEVEEVFSLPGSGQPVQVSSAWKRTKDTFTVYWNYDLLEEDGSVQRITFETRHTLLSIEGYQEEIHAAGLHLAAVYGDFTGGEYTSDSPLLIMRIRAN